MPQSKYELRSSGVQEVLKRPPNYFITWGNSIILIVLLVGLWLLSLIQFPNKITLPFQLKISKKDTFLILYSAPSLKIKKLQQVDLSFESYPSSIFGKVKSQVDTIYLIENQHCMKLQCYVCSEPNYSNKKIKLIDNLLGHIDVTIGTKNILTMIFDNRK